MKSGSSCTSILVGKNATIDGSTMIARNDDTFYAVAPHKFIQHPAVHQKGRTLKSWLNGFEAELPENSYRYPAVPNVDYQKFGYYEESGINEKNVAMSATESTYGNERVLAFDPLVEDGLDEDCIVNMTLPYVDSARGAVQYLGQLIKKFGSPAGNSVLFSDSDEVWYMEISSGHHWVAQRIPDDAYAICANQVSIQQVDFYDQDNFMYSEGIEEFVTNNHLNPDQSGFNYRHIFGTSNEKDHHYNTPRVWYGQKYFNPEIEQDPKSDDLPFICRTNKKITPDDIQFILGSHYNETPFDPLSKGDDPRKYLYRPIGLNRTQNSHILQIRNDVPKDVSAIMWLCIGYPTFAPFVPFFTNMNDTAPSYNDTQLTYRETDAYWLYRALSVLVESNYTHFIQLDRDYLTDARQTLRARVADITNKAVAIGISGEALTDYLTKENQETVRQIEATTRQFMGELYTKGITVSHLTFNMDKNL
ncbi:C69 family dipeptidase [Xylocopilactobacillus apicola]|uniref:Dipeptidase n=1 Tax=Xylocopilactobacillus apicola TaxID=2932184 RepID=A0AAU9DW96_9LACO|nr:C69 family dipeptidase [Xylocopilactobacillus apicola]BDR58233.1 dipeptidase [Xylocopilactobacillus apicola]